MGGADLPLVWRIYPSPLGTLRIAFLEGAVVRLRFSEEEFPQKLPLLTGPLAEALDRYFRGEREDFRGVPVRLLFVRGAFAQRVLETLRLRVPYGRTVTYGELARMVGKPKAARAVGQALAANPVPLIIPCHRVVARSGLGGYTGGKELKRRLLELEGAFTPTRSFEPR